jgi:hypothetical protein
MKQTLKFFHLALLALLLLASVERPAFAYTDPGSGALLWQALLAGLTGLMFYARRIAIWFKARGPKNSAGSRDR